MGFSFKVAKASEYIIVTGWGIQELKLAKKAWILPGQRSSVLDITPVNYSFDVQAMSAEKLPFILPAVFTIGPLADDTDSLVKYARLLTPHDKLSNHVKDLVRGVVEGETRVLAASMTMEQIFQGTKEFKQQVFDKVQLELNQFGLHIYNANIKQLVDVEGHEYFSYLGQKVQQEAANKAKVDVAEAAYKGNVGAKEREGLTLQNAARVEAETKIFTKQQHAVARQQELKIEAETKVFQNAREAEMKEADATLAKKAAKWKQEADVAKIEAEQIAAIRKAELEKDLELRKAAAETERLRAAQLAPAIAQYDVTVQKSNALLYEKQRQADAANYEQERRADGTRAAADAALYSEMKTADAKLYSARQEAAALLAKAEAEAAYVSSMLKAFNGNAAAMQSYLMLDRGVYQEMAKINAGAIQGLQPKISIWNTDGHGGAGGAIGEMSNVFKAIPPLFGTIQEQTGVAPLPWLATLPRPNPAK